jgi:hypothetical protein
MNCNIKKTAVIIKIQLFRDYRKKIDIQSESQ